MANGNRKVAFAFALVLSGCAALTGHKGGAKKDQGPAPTEVKLIAPKGDSVGTVDAGLKGPDSTKAPSAYASELYLQTLDNYLAVSPGDEKASEILTWKGNQ
jgi:hypothetical protein